MLPCQTQLVLRKHAYWKHFLLLLLFSFSKDQDCFVNASLTQVVFTLYAAVLAIWRQTGCCTYSVLKLNVMNDHKLPSDGN